ncbi:hypothetical protein ACLOJK_010260 [Asimina triloba]
MVITVSIWGRFNPLAYFSANCVKGIPLMMADHKETVLCHHHKEPVLHKEQ